MTEQPLRLNLGCGSMRVEGFVGVDSNPNAKAAEVYHDLNVFPYPFAESSVDEVRMEHILEHLERPIDVILEVGRICKPGARITILSPHFSCNWLHPGHKSALSTMLFDYLSPNEGEYYGSGVRFDVEKLRLRWLRPSQRHGPLLRGIGRVIDLLANAHVGVAQRIWAYYVGGFEEMEFVAVVRK